MLAKIVVIRRISGVYIQYIMQLNNKQDDDELPKSLSCIINRGCYCQITHWESDRVQQNELQT